MENERIDVTAPFSLQTEAGQVQPLDDHPVQQELDTSPCSIFAGQCRRLTRPVVCMLQHRTCCPAVSLHKIQSSMFSSATKPLNLNQQADLLFLSS